MEIYYCQSCGKRVPQGSPVGRDATYCADCPPGTQAAQASSRATPHVKAKVVPPRTTHGSIAAATSIRKDSGGGRIAPAQLPLVVGGVLAVFALILFFIVQRKPTPTAVVKDAADSISRSPREPQDRLVHEDARARPAPPVSAVPSAEVTSPKPPSKPKPKESQTAPVPLPAVPTVTAVGPGAPPEGYAKPATSHLWTDFESGKCEPWNGALEVMAGGYTPASKHALKISGEKGAAVSCEFKPTERTVLRLAIWASPEAREVQVMCWDNTVQDNVRFQHNSKTKPGTWNLVKVPFREFFYWGKKKGPVGNLLNGVKIWMPEGGYCIVDDVTVFEE